MFLEGDQQKLEKWADDLAAQVELAWSHRRDILLGGATGLNTRFERYRSLEAAATGAIFEKGNWSDIQKVFLSIPARKLIIVGEAGSGKTLITLQLVTSLLESRKTNAKDAETDCLPSLATLTGTGRSFATRGDYFRVVGVARPAWNSGHETSPRTAATHRVAAAPGVVTGLCGRGVRR